MAVFDEYLDGSHSRDYLKDNDLEPIVSISINSKNEDMVIIFNDNLNMVDLFRGLAKAICIISKLTKKDTDTIMKMLQTTIELEKAYDK